MQNCEVEIKEDVYFSKSDKTDGYKLQSLAIGVCDALYAAIRYGVRDAKPVKLREEIQSVMLYICVLYEAITMESGCFTFHFKRTHLIK